MMSTTQKRRARYAVEAYGTTYAEEAGITLRDKPAPLYQLLVLATLLSARISARIALAAARELHQAGYRTPRRMADATWQQRVDALGRGGYRRYDERTATMLGEGAEQLLTDHRGDLRELRGDDREGPRRCAPDSRSSPVSVRPVRRSSAGRCRPSGRSWCRTWTVRRYRERGGLGCPRTRTAWHGWFPSATWRAWPPPVSARHWMRRWLRPSAGPDPLRRHPSA